LKEPDFEDSFIVRQNIPISSSGFAELVETKLVQHIRDFSSVLNPFQLHHLIVFIPTLAMQVVMAIKFSDKIDISNIVYHFLILTKISLELEKSQEHQQLHSESIKNAVFSCFRALHSLQHFDIQIPVIEEFQHLSASLASDDSFQTGNVFIPPIPESHLPPGLWQTQAEMFLQSSHMNQILSNESFFTVQSQPVTHSNFLDFLELVLPNDISPSKPISKTPQTKGSNQLKQSDVKHEKKITQQDMVLAVKEAVVEIPSESNIEEFLPVSISLDDSVQHQVSIELAEMMKVQSIEDLFEIEYLTVKNSIPGKSGLKTISEGRIFEPKDGTLDYLSQNEERNDEIQELELLSLQFQSLLYSDISKKLVPFNDNHPSPLTIRILKFHFLLTLFLL
jgi:hypothetical protein